VHPDLEAPCASHIPASVASQSARIKSKPTAANQFCPCLTKQQGPKSTNGFQSVVCGPLGCRETIFVSLFGVRKGKKGLNTFNFYKTISSERLVQHSVHSAQENILLWILANHSSVWRLLGYGLGFRSWQEHGIFLFSKTSRPALGPTQPPSQWILGSLSPGREVHHRPQSNAGVKAESLYGA
jgi:hypothetical protein